FIIPAKAGIQYVYKTETSNNVLFWLHSKEFMEYTNGVWNFSGESKKRVGHPAPFPVELPKRCIKLFTFVGDTILDPFLGSGSTLLACLETGREGIGVGYNRNICERIKKQIINAYNNIKVGAYETERN
ncbi:site-specific DNA-methyltransferase, partial [bacterium]|nr:site-specific DNA-methyltransferase [bacterium]